MTSTPPPPGVRIGTSDSDSEDFYYRWQAVGEWLGIDPKYIAKDVTTARVHQTRIAQRQFAVSSEGHTLIQSWLDALAEMAPLKRMKPYVSAAIECMLGPNVAPFLGLRSNANELQIARRNLKRFGPPDHWLHRGSLRRKLYDRAMYAGLMTLFLKDRGRHRPTFALPVRKHA